VFSVLKDLGGINRFNVCRTGTGCKILGDDEGIILCLRLL